MDKDKPIKSQDILKDLGKEKEITFTEEETQENYTNEQSDKFFKEESDTEIMEIDFE